MICNSFGIDDIQGIRLDDIQGIRLDDIHGVRRDRDAKKLHISIGYFTQAARIGISSRAVYINCDTKCSNIIFAEQIYHIRIANISLKKEVFL